MMKIFKQLLIALSLISALMLAACVGDVVTNNQTGLDHVCADDEKGLLACTMDYTPVCGDDGETYGNACSACASGTIVGWNSGECEAGTIEPAEKKVIDFESCVEAGNPVMESFPQQCSHEGKTYVESVAHTCTEEELGNMVCTREYMPVCGNDGETYSNDCTACGSNNIQSWTLGECIAESTPESVCLSFDGTWIEDTKECEWMPKEQCDSMGGVFNECASACRNEPEAMVCTMQCVLVCDFE